MNSSQIIMIAKLDERNIGGSKYKLTELIVSWLVTSKYLFGCFQCAILADTVTCNAND